MNVRYAALVASLTCAGALAVVPASATAAESQTPVVTGCPAGYVLFAVPVPGTSPYKVPGQLDSLANGGNGDGFVCARQLPEAVVVAYCLNYEPKACILLADGLPLYNFVEDDNPAQGATGTLDFGI